MGQVAWLGHSTLGQAISSLSWALSHRWRDARGERQGLCRAGVVIAAGSLRWPAAIREGLLTSAPPRQQVQTETEGDRWRGQRGHWQPGGWVFPARLLGAWWGTCWVSSLVFPHKAGSYSPGRKVGWGERALYCLWHLFEKLPKGGLCFLNRDVLR